MNLLSSRASRIRDRFLSWFRLEVEYGAVFAEECEVSKPTVTKWRQGVLDVAAWRILQAGWKTRLSFAKVLVDSVNSLTAQNYEIVEHTEESSLAINGLACFAKLLDVKDPEKQLEGARELKEIARNIEDRFQEKTRDVDVA